MSPTAKRRSPVEATLLQSLGRVALAAARSQRGPQGAARKAIAEIRRLLQVDGAAVFAYEPRSGLLQPLAETRSAIRETPVRPGEGAIGRAFSEREPVVFSDYARWREAVPEMLPRGMVAGAAVPLLSEGRSIGTLGVWTYEPREFGAADLETLTLFADHLAPLLEGALNRQAALEQARELRALHELAVASAGETDARRIAETVGRRACELLDMDVYSVARWDGEDQGLMVIGTNFPGWDGIPVPMPRAGAVALAFEQGAPVAIEDYGRHPQRNRAAGTVGLRSALAVPLLYEDRPVGAIALASARARRFLPAHTDLLALLAAQVAPRFHSALLHAEVAASEERFRTVVESLPAGVVVVDPEGRLVEANPAARRILAIEQVELPAPLADVVPVFGEGDQPLEFHERPSGLAARSGRAVMPTPLRVVRGGQPDIWLIVGASPILREGRVQAVVVSFVDVTAQRRLDELRGEAQARSRFLSSMSHELRTPMNAVLGFAQLLESNAAARLTDPDRRQLEHIKTSGRHMLDLIDDVLAISALQAGGVESEPMALEVAGAVEDALVGLRRELERKRLVLRLDTPVSVWVRADPRHLHRVLWNLLSNAVKFTPEGGRVSLVARQLEAGRVAIEVADTGVGIAAPDLERVFDEFSQVDAGGFRGREGTGLGLALCRRLLALMGGSISARSEVGEGSVFTAELPAAEPSERG